MNKQISIKEAILYAVNAVISNPWYFVKLTVAWIGASFLFLMVPALFFGLFMFGGYVAPLFLIVAYFVLYVFGVFVWILPTKLLFRFYDHGAEPFSLGLFISQFSFRMICKLLAAAFLFNLIIGAGLILLIAPGIYLLVKFCLVFFTIIDTNCGIIEAFRRSYRATKDNFWRLCGLLVIAALLLNLIITIPVSVLMLIHAYRQLNPA